MYKTFQAKFNIMRQLGFLSQGSWKKKKNEASSLNCRLCSDKTTLEIISVWGIQNNYVNEAGTSYSILFKVNVGQFNYCKFLQYPLAETSSHVLMSLFKWMVKKIKNIVFISYWY